MRSVLLVWPFLLGLLAASSVSPAQSPEGTAPRNTGPGASSPGQPGASTFGRPDAIIQVSRDPIGADLVTVSMQDGNYPPTVLQAQAQAFGQDAQSNPRGVQVVHYFLRPNDASTAFWRATFAVNGLIDPVHGRFNLQPIVRAFAGVPEPHTIKSMTVSFDGSFPGAQPLQQFHSSAVQVDGRRVGQSYEYQIRLLSQDPKSIVIPDGNEPAPVPTASGRSHPDHGSDVVLYVVLGIAAVATGALVYSLILMRSGTGRRGRR